MKSPLPIGIIGTGDEGGVLIGALNPEYVDVVAISDIRPYNVHRAIHGDQSSPAVQAVRPGVDGKYAIKDLPAGEYLLAAVTDIDQNEWQDPAFLERLQPASIKVTIADGEKKTLDLRVGG